MLYLLYLSWLKNVSINIFSKILLLYYINYIFILGLLSAGKKLHIASALLGVTGAFASFYTIYKITQAYTGV